MFDGRRPSLSSSNPVEELFRLGSITARSLPKKGREFYQSVVRPSSAAAPLGPQHTASSVASSLRSSFRSLTDFKSDGEGERTTPDGASLTGEGKEEQEVEEEEETPIYV